MEPGTVKLSALTKRFGDLVAVKSLDLEIPAGGFFSLIGPSGCGKTTTLRMVAGLEHPDEGTIEVGGEDITRRPAYRRAVELDRAAVGLLETCKQADQRALAAARRPDHDGQLVALDREGAVLHHFSPEGCLAVSLEDARDLNLARLDALTQARHLAGDGAHRNLSHGVTAMPSLRMIALEIQPAMPIEIMPTTISG